MLFIIAFLGLVSGNLQDLLISDVSNANTAPRNLRRLERTATLTELATLPFCKHKQSALAHDACKCGINVCNKVQYCHIENLSMECTTVLRIWWVSMIFVSILLSILCTILCALWSCCPSRSRAR
eukprot:GEMP01065961.1.p1 GENE.GEMP01065961.1~~GEMP01065961.1.p1  ORF type:complete len:125 (+),score=10.29 GEMP01065961.1:68-442(+)